MIRQKVVAVLLASGMAGYCETPVKAPIIVHPELQRSAKALGDRLTIPGKERMTLSGAMTHGGKNSSLTITAELPNLVRADFSGGEQKTAGFDGALPWSSDVQTSEDDADVLESLIDDSPETMMNSLSHGSVMRLLTPMARMDNGKTPDYKGPWAAIYEVVGPTGARPGAARQQKHYYFDSETGLPLSVRYRLQKTNGKVVDVETTRTDWRTVNGQAVPGTITRYENGKAVFVFKTSGAGFAPAAKDATFAKK